jgi:hypothetical protein
MQVDADLIFGSLSALNALICVFFGVLVPLPGKRLGAIRLYTLQDLVITSLHPI